LIVFFLSFFFIRVRINEGTKKISESTEGSNNVYFSGETTEITFPPSISLYFHIKKYSNKYAIPIKFAFGIAYKESRYKGPLNLKYNPYLVSSGGALGPMQIMYDTGKKILKVMGREKDSKNLTREELKTNIELNVEISMFLVRRLYDKYGNWKLAFGAYNTGSPCVNQYANEVFNFKP
jgi:soluble lytic murein transglycosylase-like protein